MKYNLKTYITKSEEKNQDNIKFRVRKFGADFQKQKNDKRAIFGYGLIAVGVLFIAKKTGIIPTEISHYLFPWASFFIRLGLLNIFVKKNLRAGLILMSIGSIWQVILKNGVNLKVSRLRYEELKMILEI